MIRHSKPNESGSIIVSILMVTLFLTTLVYSLIVLANANMSRARGRILILQAQYAAESGADAAISTLNNTNASYTGTGASEVVVLNNGRYKATYVSTVVDGATSNDKTVTATGKLYEPAGASTPKYTRTIEIKASRSTTTTSSAMVSRNIINIQSGVKRITAVDVTLNGYLLMNKNTTELVAENITVGGRMTGAGNCSIAGSGNIVKPTTFTHVGQTKTNITLAYNNCLSNPPGNTSNANFNISANNSNIQTIQSTFIPWSQYMDATYLNASNGCNDWTTGTFPRTIPSTAKRTHYPDNGNGVVASCGSSGDLNIGNGQYNITDNVHIRGHLCLTYSCTPTFYNPTASTKYVFVEGTVGFAAVKTATGSGPIVIVSYGSDPASRTGACPEGGAVYIGNDNSGVDAPKLYLLAQNGICLDKTKFGAAKALGGLSGKNLYISSNSGTPFELGLDETFPTTSIPVNLAWKATQYRRL